jgi:proline iminopeptidase
MTDPNSGANAPARAIDEAGFVDIGGEPQWMTLRGEDIANPAVLVLSGPGVAFSALSPLFEAWTRDLTVVNWDQPHAGVTFDRHGPPADYDFDRLARDAATVAEAACARLGAPRLAVLGISGGSIVGLKLAKARPDLVRAYVGTGQVVNWARQEALAYAAVLARAQTMGDAELVADLRRIGPPPWRDIADEALAGQHANATTAAETAAFQAIASRLAARTGHDVRAVATAAFTGLKPQFAAFDAADLGPDFQVPMIFLQGDQDLRTATSEVETYAGGLDAPVVTVERLEDAGHSAYLTETFRRRLVDHLKGLRG